MMDCVFLFVRLWSLELLIFSQALAEPIMASTATACWYFAPLPKGRGVSTVSRGASWS